ncbi:uncharacterized protein LOC130736742 [Lotus japonicus]|uniref:uncharacterized protein LOC130736742 n=1 Tax=Lotus japonicus TaxID=34305 RepID=UPI002588537D|nr:uncharacterized protein LOC130736742 [Lotus japonicus]
MEALEGRALTWFQWWTSCNPNSSWEGFKIAVVRRFQPSMIQNPFELLLSLKQMGSVKDYAEEFEKFVGSLREIDPEFVKGTFLKGLKEEIRIEVQLYELHSLSEVIQKYIFIEQEMRESEAASEAERAVEKVFQRLSENAAPHKPNLDSAETEQTATVAIQRFNLETEGEPAIVNKERDAVEALQHELEFASVGAQSLIFEMK